MMAAIDGFGERLFLARTKKDWTQEEFASVLGIAQHTISLWETGKMCPQLRHLPALCVALGCSADYLLGLADSMSSRTQPSDVSFEDWSMP